MQPDTRYARSGDLHIAYQVFGEGSTDLVIVLGEAKGEELPLRPAPPYCTGVCSGAPLLPHLVVPGAVIEAG
jgi:hypothetical protein